MITDRPAVEDPRHPNPLGTDGFAFIEFAAIDPQPIARLLESFGFSMVAHHKTKPIIKYQQGAIIFLLNASRSGFASEFVAKHGPSCCSIGFKVRDACKALNTAYLNRAKEYTVGNQSFPMAALKGVGGSLIYLVDEKINRYFDLEFMPTTNPNWHQGTGLQYIDHLTHNVYRGHMNWWADFYERVFGFYEVRYFNIKGKHTGLISRAMTSPCGKIRIPINESIDDESQIEEYLREYHGEGIQHIALGSANIYSSINRLKSNGVKFQDVPDNYYEEIDKRLGDHGENIDELHRLKILIDGNTESGVRKLLLQIFTHQCIGPIFFEIIQRKGDQGFGEGNFQALFDSIERDQIRRGIIKNV